MITLYEANGIASLSKLESFPTFEAAEAFARSTYDVRFFEADADYADCADFLTGDGRMFVIQPEGLRVS